MISDEVIYSSGLVLTSTLYSVMLKRDNSNIYLLNLMTTLIIFIMSFIKNRLSDNILPFKTMFGLDSFLISSAGVGWLIGIYLLKKLPLSVSLPLGSTWILVALVFEKYLLDYEIEYEHIKILGTFFMGVILVNFHHFKDFKVEYKLAIILLVIRVFIRSFRVTYTKKVSDKYTSNDMLLMDYSSSLPLAIIAALLTYKKYKSDYAFKNISYLLLIISTIAASKEYIRFKAIKILDENLYNTMSQMTIITSIICGYLFFKEGIRTTQIVGSIIMLYSIYELNNKTK